MRDERRGRWCPRDVTLGEILARDYPVIIGRRNLRKEVESRRCSPLGSQEENSQPAQPAAEEKDNLA